MNIKVLAFSGAGIGAVATPTAVYCDLRGFFGETAVDSEYSAPSPEPISTGTTSYALDKTPDNCAGRFFPGVRFGTSSTAGKDGNIPDHNVEAGKQVGCALLQLDYKGGDNFAFSAEIAVKTDRVGWAIQVYVNTKNEEGTGVSLDSTHRFTYTIFWLQRNAYTKKWKVDSGVYVKTKNMMTISEAGISFPNKTILTAGNRASGITDNDKVWLGVWEESASAGNKPIFEDINLKYNQSADNHLCLGIPQPNQGGVGFGPCCDANCGSTQIMEVQKTYKNRSWSDALGTFSEICQKYNEQLKSKTGIWSWSDSPQTFCETLKNEVESSPSDQAKKRKLLNFCHSYKIQSH